MQRGWGRRHSLFPIDIAAAEFDKFNEVVSSALTRQNGNQEGSMRSRGLTGGHLCIDLTNIEMSGEDQQDLLRAVQTTVVAHLARQSAMSKVVTISMSPNNGQDPRPEPDRSPDPDRNPRPNPPPKPDPKPDPDPRS
jgi:hypothetical protein